MLAPRGDPQATHIQPLRAGAAGNRPGGARHVHDPELGDISEESAGGVWFLGRHGDCAEKGTRSAPGSLVGAVLGQGVGAAQTG